MSCLFLDQAEGIVVLPLSVDEKVFLIESYFPESLQFQGFLRPDIVQEGRRLKPVEHEIAEGIVHDGLQGVLHDSLAFKVLVKGIAKVRASEPPIDEV